MNRNINPELVVLHHFLNYQKEFCSAFGLNIASASDDELWNQYQEWIAEEDKELEDAKSSGETVDRLDARIDNLYFQSQWIYRCFGNLAEVPGEVLTTTAVNRLIIATVQFSNKVAEIFEEFNWWINFDQEHYEEVLKELADCVHHSNMGKLYTHYEGAIKDLQSGHHVGGEDSFEIVAIEVQENIRYAVKDRVTGKIKKPSYWEAPEHKMELLINKLLIEEFSVQ